MEDFSTETLKGFLKEDFIICFPDGILKLIFEEIPGKLPESCFEEISDAKIVASPEDFLKEPMEELLKKSMEGFPKESLNYGKSLKAFLKKSLEEFLNKEKQNGGNSEVFERILF